MVLRIKCAGPVDLSRGMDGNTEMRLNLDSLGYL